MTSYAIAGPSGRALTGYCPGDATQWGWCEVRQVFVHLTGDAKKLIASSEGLRRVRWTKARTPLRKRMAGASKPFSTYNEQPPYSKHSAASASEKSSPSRKLSGYTRAVRLSSDWMLRIDRHRTTAGKSRAERLAFGVSREAICQHHGNLDAEAYGGPLPLAPNRWTA